MTDRQQASQSDVLSEENIINFFHSLSPEEILQLKLSDNGIYDNLMLDGLKAFIERQEEQMKRKEVLSKYKIYQFNYVNYKGQWFAKKDGKKLHQAKTKEELEKIIIEAESHTLTKEQTTFRAIYFASQEDYTKRIKDPGKLVSAQNTVAVHIRTYKRFIEGTNFENLQIDSINRREITNFLDSIIESQEIKKQAFKNLKTVLNQAFKYALKLELITINPLDSVYWDDYKYCYSQSAPVKERGYSMDEMAQMYQMTIQNEINDPSDARHWSYEFNLLTAARRAEIPPIKWSDVYWDEGYIDIHQEEIGKKPYIIKPTTKTAIDRYFPITDTIADFLTRLKRNNEKYHPGSEYLFPDEKQELGCITPNVTYRAHKKICKQLGIDIDQNIPRGTHAFRRVHQTAFLEGGGSLDLASKVYGNSPKVVQEHYLLGVNAKASSNIVDLTQRRFANTATQ